MKPLSRGGALFRRTKRVHWPAGLAPEIECLEALWIGTGFGIVGGMLRPNPLRHRLPDVMCELLCQRKANTDLLAGR